MTKYKNLNGDSSIKSFELGENFIDIIFSKKIYRYSYASAGRDNVETMKQLAVAGFGLNRYLSKHCYELYEFKRDK